MEFGVVLQPNPPATGVVAMMKRAEAAGFGYGWTFDSHVLWQETFVLYPRILAETSAMVDRADGDQPGDAGLVGDRVHVRDAERHVRQPDDLRHRPRRLGPPVHRPGTGHAGHPVVRDVGHQGPGRRARGDPPRPAAAHPMGHAGGSLPVWMAAYGPKALRLVGEQADGFILQTADPDIARWTFGAVREAAADAGATRRRSPCASPRPPTWGPTWRTSGNSCAGSAGWWATTWRTWSRATAPTGRCRAR